MGHHACFWRSYMGSWFIEGEKENLIDKAYTCICALRDKREEQG